MIGLSVAVGRFVEALFWGIFRVAGAVAGVMLCAAVVLVVMFVVARKVWKRRR
ncbi:hypothetical protein [Sphingomonas sp. R86521]|uniref:hypothetical protein n=1 Tax=Sphingomonas sp. R86521 TaxID=3093860 RepID=UPI0036D20969